MGMCHPLAKPSQSVLARATPRTHTQTVSSTAFWFVHAMCSQRTVLDVRRSRTRTVLMEQLATWENSATVAKECVLTLHHPQSRFNWLECGEFCRSVSEFQRADRFAASQISDYITSVRPAPSAVIF